MFHKVKLIFKVYIKTNKAKKDSEKKHVKNIKIFLQKKKTKNEKAFVKDVKALLKKKKETSRV